jgi:hypothetical protein
LGKIGARKPTLFTKRVAGDKPGLVGPQPHHGVGDLVRLADPPHGVCAQ